MITINGRQFIPMPPLVGDGWKDLDRWWITPADGHGVDEQEWRGVMDALPSWIEANCIVSGFVSELAKPVYAVFGGHIGQISKANVQYAIGTVIDKVIDGHIGCVANSLIREISGKSKVGKCRQSSAVYRLTDEAVIVNAGDSTHITFVAGNSHVGEVYGQGKVLRILHNASIGLITDKARVDEMCDDSRIDIASGKAVIGKMMNRAEILLLSDKAKVLTMDNETTVHKAWDESQVVRMTGRSRLLYATSLVVVREIKGAAKVYFDGKPFYYGKMPKGEGIVCYTAKETDE